MAGDDCAEPAGAGLSCGLSVQAEQAEGSALESCHGQKTRDQFQPTGSQDGMGQKREADTPPQQAYQVGDQLLSYGHDPDRLVVCRPCCACSGLGQPIHQGC
ncbi:protein of unknown function [Magnetospirillum sp. XM-1]|nr:protein of unknown function [Magnetospirillum sp. XM-1]